MKKYEQFSACLRRILEEEGISASEVSRLVGFRSRNSIFRILSDQTSIRVQEEFYDALKEHIGSGWPQRHWLELEEALEISRMGVVDYQDRKAFRELVLSGARKCCSISLNLPQPESGYTTQEIRPLIRHAAASGRLEITICGCLNVSLCTLLAEELAAAGREGRVSVRHFVNMADDVAVQNVIAIQPLLYYSWYDALLVEPGVCPEEMSAIYQSNMMIMMHTAENGEKHVRNLLMHNQHTLYLAESRPCDGEDKTVRLLNFYGRYLPKLKNNFPVSMSVGDYVSYTSQLRQMEKDKEIFSIKPDISIYYIHPDVLRSSALDGFRQSGFLDPADMPCFVQQFYDVHLNRYNNIMNKRKVTNVVFSFDAMKNFVLTGKQTNHFFAMRPYTLAERMAIIKHLRDQTVNNPYFSIRFLKKGTPLPSMEIALYEGVGVMFTKVDTTYNLSGDHAEALVTHKGFARKFREFYMQELLPKYATTYQETIAAFDELARIATEEG